MQEKWCKRREETFKFGPSVPRGTSEHIFNHGVQKRRSGLPALSKTHSVMLLATAHSLCPGVGKKRNPNDMTLKPFPAICKHNLCF